MQFTKEHDIEIWTIDVTGQTIWFVLTTKPKSSQGYTDYGGGFDRRRKNWNHRSKPTSGLAIKP